MNTNTIVFSRPSLIVQQLVCFKYVLSVSSGIFPQCMAMSWIASILFSNHREQDWFLWLRKVRILGILCWSFENEQLTKTQGRGCCFLQKAYRIPLYKCSFLGSGEQHSEMNLQKSYDTTKKSPLNNTCHSKGLKTFLTVCRKS